MRLHRDEVPLIWSSESVHARSIKFEMGSDKCLSGQWLYVSIQFVLMIAAFALHLCTIDALEGYMPYQWCFRCIACFCTLLDFIERVLFYCAFKRVCFELTDC